MLDKENAVIGINMERVSGKHHNEEIRRTQLDLVTLASVW